MKLFTAEWISETPKHDDSATIVPQFWQMDILGSQREQKRESTQLSLIVYCNGMA